MRIISGKYRGKKLIKFNKEGIKPTTDKIRESIFNIVISYLQINEKKKIFPLKVLMFQIFLQELGLQALKQYQEELKM